MTNRRGFLKRAGVIGVLVASAGCTSSQQENGDGSNNGANGGNDDSGAGDGGDNTNGNKTTTDEGGDATATGGTATSNESDGGGITEVAAGPNGNLVFEPKTVEIALGSTVKWNFKSPGHNVSAKPEVSSVVKLPQGAEPFASYSGDKSYQIVPEGESYSHTFETPGKYVYVCVPHVSAGMVGTVKVSK